MLTLDITPFSSGHHHVTLHPPPDAVDLDPDAFRDLEVEADLHCRPDRILVHLTVEGTATLTCDRTLEPYDQPLEGTYTVLFGPSSLVGSESDRYDEVRPLHRTDQEIDLTDIVRDTLRLAIPQRRIAPGAEEESIPTTFGEPDETEQDEPDIDPRWSELKQLRDDLDDQDAS